MTDKQKKKIVALYDDNPLTFSCHLCCQEVTIKSCKGCPIYSQAWYKE